MFIRFTDDPHSSYFAKVIFPLITRKDTNQKLPCKISECGHYETECLKHHLLRFIKRLITDRRRCLFLLRSLIFASKSEGTRHNESNFRRHEFERKNGECFLVKASIDYKKTINFMNITVVNCLPNLCY